MTSQLWREKTASFAASASSWKSCMWEEISCHRAVSFPGCPTYHALWKTANDRGEKYGSAVASTMHPNFYADDCHCFVSAEVKAREQIRGLHQVCLLIFICNQHWGGGMVKLAVPLLCEASIDFAEVKSRKVHIFSNARFRMKATAYTALSWWEQLPSHRRRSFNPMPGFICCHHMAEITGYRGVLFDCISS